MLSIDKLSESQKKLINLLIEEFKSSRTEAAYKSFSPRQQKIMNDFNKKLGLKIKKLRERRKLTREKLGEAAEISDRFIYDVETGQKGISAETLYKLSRALNVTSDYLLFEAEENKNELSYVTEILKNLSPSELESVEKIILEISKLTSKNQQASRLSNREAFLSRKIL